MYPILIDLSKFSILVVGGGTIATRKVEELILAGGRPVLIAPKVTTRLYELSVAKKIDWKKHKFEKGDTKKFQIIFICTDNKEVNTQIVAETTDDQLVNDTTNKKNSNFFNMDTIREEDLILSISTQGNSPSKAKKLKAQLKKFLTSVM